MALIDMTGQRWGRLTVIERTGSDAYKASLWLCQCDCGNQAIVRSTSLRLGITQSCGCLRREVSAEAAKELGLAWGPKTIQGASGITHGHAVNQTRSPTYGSWTNMKQRCAGHTDGPHRRSYYDRGITVCDRWLSFENFLADMGERPEGTTLDRIDNDGNYEPGNCRWATTKEQAANRRSNQTLVRAENLSVL